ncbi:MAG: hypothetical protein IPM56_15810 [Ignavibacteriales bacterium]|nr:MAG: hypothetical protein IPM56_15810 [Ignavibacteriales bacterium]
MNNTEKIFELLQKKELNKDENELLNQIIASDPEAGSFYKTYLTTGKIIKQISHPDIEQLAEYVLFKNGNNPENKKIINEIPSIEKHLRSCTQCSEEIKVLFAEYSDVDQYVAGEIKDAVTENKNTEAPVNVRKSNSSFRYMFMSAAAVVLIYIGLVFSSSIFTPDAQKLASLDQDTDYYVTRGRVTTHFQESLKSLESGDFENAIQNLKADISENQNDETVFYSHYILGLAYLETAGNSVIGLFPSYNGEQAILGRDALIKSVELNTSGKFPNITLNAYYYAAKASLMIEDINSAKKYLNMVISGKGSKMTEAQKILTDLE